MNADALFDTLLKNFSALLFWVILFLIFHFACRYQRLSKDMIKNAYQDTEKLKKLSKSLEDAVIKGPITKKDAKKKLGKVRRMVKNTKSILQLYVYENGDDPNLAAAIGLFNSVDKDYSSFARAFNLDSKDDIKVALDKSCSDLDKVSIVLGTVVKTREEEALMKL